VWAGLVVEVVQSLENQLPRMARWRLALRYNWVKRRREMIVLLVVNISVLLGVLTLVVVGVLGLRQELAAAVSAPNTVPPPPPPGPPRASLPGPSASGVEPSASDSGAQVIACEIYNWTQYGLTLGGCINLHIYLTHLEHCTCDYLALKLMIASCDVRCTLSTRAMLQGPLNVALQVLVILGGALVTFVTAAVTWRGYVRSISQSVVDKLKLLQLPDHKSRIGYQNEVRSGSWERWASMFCLAVCRHINLF
jgi:hypothetical protein